MVKYACFTLATLVLLTYTDFIAARSVAQFDLSVNDMNRCYPGIIPTNVDGNLSAIIWLINRNLGEILEPLLNQEQGVDLDLLTHSQMTSQLWRIYNEAWESEVSFTEKHPIMKISKKAIETLEDASEETTAMNLLVNVNLLSVLMEDLVALCQ